MVTSAGEWRLVETNEGEESAAYMVFRTWSPASALWLSLVEDMTTKACVLIAFGADGEQVADLAHRMSVFVPVMSREEVLAGPDMAEDPQGRIPAILRVALAAGPEFDAGLFRILTETAQDPDPFVRNATAWSTTYLEWPQSLDLLRELASQDPDERVRQSARDLLNDFQRT
ncbi:HEAT repeat domain-containing protein [Streptomyces lanatus]|uniref:HEAT repeat domain-containing protein n=1 Tax=Streptomyces lanatus TaxID=66900 RepID=A0ABV1Y7C8_9ACTN|nr:HEAT repeat domain-containing protein [Streptomyces lanatus]